MRRIYKSRLEHSPELMVVKVALAILQRGRVLVYLSLNAFESYKDIEIEPVRYYKDLQSTRSSYTTTIFINAVLLVQLK